MNIGIIIYSRSGNVRGVAEELKKKLDAGGHTVRIDEITLTGEFSQRDFQLARCPDVEGYDGIIFGGAVNAFSLNVVMKAYLQRIGSLTGKPVACFATKFLPGKWTGGNQAVRQMKTLCKARGAVVKGSGVINLKNADKDAIIADVVDSVAGVFSAV
jgi:NAD(P)H dehydrogenase (quinone)